MINKRSGGTKEGADEHRTQPRTKDKKTQDPVMAADRTFMAQLSHDLKTPLNAIIGYSQILKESLSDPTLVRYITIIRSSGETLLSIVNKHFDPSLTGHGLDQPQAAASPQRNAADAVQPADTEKPGQHIDADGKLKDALAINDRIGVDALVKEAQSEWNAHSLKELSPSTKNIIFAIDDNENNLGVIAHLFADGHVKVFLFSSGAEALSAMDTIMPNLILLDIAMPVMDGFEVCRRLKASEKTKGIPIIFLTSHADSDVIVQGFQAGIVDYIVKPFKTDELLSRVTTHLKLYQTEQSLSEALTEKDLLLNETLKGSIKVLIDILAMANPDAFAQTLRVRGIAKKMAQRLGLVNEWEIEIGILLSHLGCAVIPAEIVKKKQNGKRLTSREQQVFNSHPTAAARFISNIPRLDHVAQSIRNQFINYSIHADADIIRDFIRIVFDYDNFLQAGYTQVKALDMMHRTAECYNLLVLGALEAEVRKFIDGYVVRSLLFEELKTGMILADDIRNMNGVTLVRRNSELSDVLLEKLQNLGQYGRLSEPVKIIELVV